METDDSKFSRLNLYEIFDIRQAIIFVSIVHIAEELKERLGQNDITSNCIHGEMDTEEISHRLQGFRMGKIRVLISIDIKSNLDTTSLTINYDMPICYEDYFSRVGRSGCYGRKGIVINL